MAEARKTPATRTRRSAATVAQASAVSSTTATGNGVPPPDPGPPLIIGEPTTSSWREQVLTRAGELRTVVRWLLAQPDVASPTADELARSVEAHLTAAEAAARCQGVRGVTRRVRAWVSGAPVERAMTNLDAAEIDVLRLAPPSYLCGNMPSLLATARKHLTVTDPRRARLEDLARKAPERALEPAERETVLSAVHGAISAGHREVTRVRSFRNVLLVAAAILSVVAVGLALLGSRDPDAIPLCFHPDGKIVCPTAENLLPSESQTATTGSAPAAGAEQASPSEIDRVTRATTSRWDLPLVELLGLISAAVAAAAALRGIRGTSTPYSLPVALAVLKLPTGALTALLGLLLMRGNFVPGLSALDSSAQIVAWAVVFGYAQQLFTRLVDQQAHAVLDDVGGGGTGPGRPAGG